MAEFAKAFVAGFPVERSLSPFIHRYWLQVYGLKGSYEPVAVTAESFPHFLADIGQKGYAGGTIIAPHKAAALALTARADAAAQNTGAVNTVWLEQGALCGTNSEVRGFAANLDSARPNWAGETALLLGAGGLAKAAICALAERGFSHIIIAAQQAQQAAGLAAAMQSKVKAKLTGCALAEARSFLPQLSLLAHCGAPEQAAAQNPSGDSPLQQEQSAPAAPSVSFDFSGVSSKAVAVETAYTAEQTPFLRAAAQAGLAAADGLGILLHQAAVGFERWFGEKPEVTAELRAYIIGKMAAG